MKGLRWFFILLSIALLLALGVLSYCAREWLMPITNEPQTIRVVISDGMGIEALSETLEGAALIRHAWSFNLLVRLTHTDERIVAGTYDLSPSLSAYDILKKIVHGEVTRVRVTFPEGFTLNEIADRLDADGIVKKAIFINYALHADMELPDGKRVHGLEGYLFPETYDFPPDSAPEAVADTMVKQFKSVVFPIVPKKANLRDAIILASMIEREAKVAKEDPIIAGVYRNRLKKGMPLECDATIQYLLAKPKEFLAEDDLKIDSPYNTYLHTGLPPGPIGNPGLPAIKAALFPAHVPYLYYVAKGNGEHQFSVTYSEHLKAVKQYENAIQHR